MHRMLRFLPLGLSLSCVSRDTVSPVSLSLHDSSLVGTVYTGMRLRSSVTLHLPTVSPPGGATATIEVKLKTINDKQVRICTTAIPHTREDLLHTSKSNTTSI